MRAWAILMILGLSAPALAQPESRVQRPLSLQTGLGFMADPEAFLVGIEGDFRLNSYVSLGSTLQFGVDDRFTLISPSLYGRYWFAFPGRDELLQRLQPYVQIGTGFTYINVDGSWRGRDDDDIGFLINGGFGADFRLTHSLSIGTKMLFNGMPGGVFGENFYFSWEVAALRLRF
jgi:hypothetical protein